jgi:hypothetical protein
VGETREHLCNPAAMEAAWSRKFSAGNQAFLPTAGQAGEDWRKTLQKDCDLAVGVPNWSCTFMVWVGILRDIPVHLRNLGGARARRCAG